MIRHDLCLDDFPLTPDEDRALVLRLISSRPDADLLRAMLGLDSQPLQPVTVEAGVCPKHLVARRREQSGQKRCPECRREASRRQHDKRRISLAGGA